MSQINYVIKKEPNWLLEVALSILAREEETTVKHINNSNSFGMSTKEMENYLSKVELFKENIQKDINPILSKYPDLDFLFEETDFEKESCPIVFGIIYAANKYLDSPDIKLHITDIINQTFIILLGEVLDCINEENFNILDISYLVDLLHNVNFEDSLKMKLIKLYSKREVIIPSLFEFLTKGTKIAQKYFYLVQEDYERCNQLIQEPEQLDEIIKRVKAIKFVEPKSLNVQCNIIYYNKLSLIVVDRVFCVDLGIYYVDLLEKYEVDESKDTRVIADLKALGDGTRLKIIHLLANKKMYLQEIADNIHLTPATVSHHINVLLQSGIVCATVNVDKAKKVYYELYTDKLIQISESIKSLVIPPRRIIE